MAQIEIAPDIYHKGKLYISRIVVVDEGDLNIAMQYNHEKEVYQISIYKHGEEDHHTIEI